jgi:hypothetical protein
VNQNSEKPGPSPAAVAAAGWWADAIGAPTFRLTDDTSTATDRANMDLVAMMAVQHADAHPVGENAGGKFAETLADAIDKALEGFERWGVSLDVDYGPCMMLTNAATAAGVDGSRFPWKTNMRVTAQYVTVSAGYRAGHRLVWASDEWLANRPMCSTQDWDESEPYRDDYHGEPFACSLPQYHDEPHAHDHPISLCAVCGWTEDRSSHGSDRQYSRDPHDFVALPAGQPFKAVSA